jgi:hypothetical protein
MSRKIRLTFAQSLPLFYFVFVFLFIFLYFVVSDSTQLGSLLTTDSAFAAGQNENVRKWCETPPPCTQNSFVCWFKSFFGVNKCLPPAPTSIPSSTPIASLPASPIGCIPRPSCYDAKPNSCMIVEPAEGWCPVASVTPLPSVTPRPIRSCYPRPSCGPNQACPLMELPESYYCATPKPSVPPVYCTQDMVACSDGSLAPRDPNNGCQAKCPASIIKPTYSCLPQKCAKGAECIDLMISDPCYYPDSL